jgi:hypothetical protein
MLLGDMHVGLRDVPEGERYPCRNADLWSRLSQATEGTTEMGPQKLAGRILEFLNGSGAPLAKAVYSPQERTLMRSSQACSNSSRRDRERWTIPTPRRCRGCWQ